ncbi:MAG: thioesterase family protein [Parvibaculum sp.]|uniref:thioesterase family protein n=1 Tax=Parvibaculum sp. TaxID=2024848 RepID=UPI0028467C8D|nr:thioesterase family protein [Parvibaculum sp.]MDR3498907.1 thioesterase family protein [Parvibaculum sp.]
MGEMIDVARSSVQTWQSDQMGHMNVQFYLDHATQGLAALGVYLGLGPRYIDAERARLIARDHHVRFLREQRPGAPFTIRAGVLDATDFGLRVYLEMWNTVSGEVAATFAADVELMDEDTREAKPLTIRAKKAVKAIKVELPAHGSPRGLEIYEPRVPPTLKEAEAMKLFFTWQGEIQPTQCDGQGFLATRHFMGIVSDAIPNLLGQTSGSDRSRNPKVGGAALEYRFHYHRYPRSGDVLKLLSGLKQVGPKTYTWCHWLFDLEQGDCVATSEAVAIALDLETRKAIPIPDEMREKLETLVVAGLGV